MEAIWRLKSIDCAFSLLKQMIVVGSVAVIECMSHKCTISRQVADRETIWEVTYSLWRTQPGLDGHERDWSIGRAAVIYLDCCWMVK